MQKNSLKFYWYKNKKGKSLKKHERKEKIEKVGHKNN